MGTQLSTSRRKLKGAEYNYSVTDRELLAINEAVNQNTGATDSLIDSSNCIPIICPCVARSDMTLNTRKGRTTPMGRLATAIRDKVPIHIGNGKPES